MHFQGVLLALFLYYHITYSFNIIKSNKMNGISALSTSSTSSLSKSKLDMQSPLLHTFNIASSLDADTLGALGDVQDLNQALDDAIVTGNPASNVLTKIVSSPLIIAIPIGAGLLVALGLGYFISSYSNSPTNKSD